MTPFYHPRPERWPQFSLRGLFFATTLAAVLSGTVLPEAVEAIRAWANPDDLVAAVSRRVPPGSMKELTIRQYIGGQSFAANSGNRRP